LRKVKKGDSQLNSDIDARSDPLKGFFYALAGSVLVSTNWVTAKYGLRGFNPETFSLVWTSAFLLSHPAEIKSAEPHVFEVR